MSGFSGDGGFGGGRVHTLPMATRPEALAAGSPLILNASKAGSPPGSLVAAAARHAGAGAVREARRGRLRGGRSAAAQRGARGRRVAGIPAHEAGSAAGPMLV